MSQSLVERIVANRPYTDLSDFMQRALPSADVARNLALCGALDCFDGNRRKILLQLGSHKPADQPQLSLAQANPRSNVEDFTDWHKCCQEWNILGFSSNWHPLQFARPRLAKKGILTAQHIKQHRPAGAVKVAGLLIRPHRPPTRSGRTVVFFTLEDETGLFDVTVFENTYQEYGKQIFSSSGLLVEGYLDGRGTASVIAQKLRMLDWRAL